VEAAGNTPLHSAAYEGWTEGIELLISLGAKVNASNNAGDRPWHWARNMDQQAAMAALEKVHLSATVQWKGFCEPAKQGCFTVHMKSNQLTLMWSAAWCESGAGLGAGAGSHPQSQGDMLFAGPSPTSVVVKCYNRLIKLPGPSVPDRLLPMTQINWLSTRRTFSRRTAGHTTRSLIRSDAASKHAASSAWQCCAFDLPSRPARYAAIAGAHDRHMTGCN
jgi:Ankyrin repeat